MEIVKISQRVGIISPIHHSENPAFAKLRYFTHACKGTGIINGTVVLSSANGMVRTGFVSRYRLQPRAAFKRPK